MLLQVLFNPYHLLEHEISFYRLKLFHPVDIIPHIPSCRIFQGQPPEQPVTGDSVNQIGVLSGSFVEVSVVEKILSDLSNLTPPLQLLSIPDSPEQNVSAKCLLEFVEQKLIQSIERFRSAPNLWISTNS
jgi:hypothetical protein